MNNIHDNQKQNTLDPYVLVDELSETEIYIGTSKTFNSKVSPIWRIKRYLKTGNVWMSGFPNGKQDFIHIWDDRMSYNYK